MDVFGLLRSEFGLRDQHIKILSFLLNNPSTAPEVCSATSIPVGRVYEYLNFLVSNSLVQKSDKRPYVYFVDDLKKNVMRYTQTRIENLVDSQSKLMLGLGDPGTGDIKLIQNSAQFTQTHISMLSHSTVFKIICVHYSYPYILYPVDLTRFLHMRKIIIESRPTITHTRTDIAPILHKSYLDALKSNKIFRVILDRNSFEFHMNLLREKLGPDFSTYIKSTLDKIKRYNISVYVLSDPSPFQIDISERHVSITFVSSNTTRGLSVQNSDVVSFFSGSFEERTQKGEPVENLLRTQIF